MSSTGNALEAHAANAAQRDGGAPRMVVSTDAGGPRFGELIEQVRTFLDRMRAALPAAETTDELIERLGALNEQLLPLATDEWHAPSGSRIDLPARGNILLPPYDVDEAGPNGVSARVRFRGFHLGHTGAVHGGYIGVAFDDLMAVAVSLAIPQVNRTAYLTVNYRSPTPLDTEIVLRAWVDSQVGRKVYVKATLHDGDRLCADAEALFVLVATDPA